MPAADDGTLEEGDGRMPSCHESCDSVIWLEETGGDKQCHYKGTEMIAPSSFLASRRPFFPMSHIPLSAKPPTPSYSDSVGCFASHSDTRSIPQVIIWSDSLPSPLHFLAKNGLKWKLLSSLR